MDDELQPSYLEKGSAQGSPLRWQYAIGAGGTANAIIHGDNQAVLTILLPSFNGQVRCVYIDPPYNNQESYTHYDDRSDHESWLRRLSAQIELLRLFLSDDGSLWVSIDDRELHYLKVAMDDIFGRSNFVCTVVWEHRKSRENRRVFSANHEYILVYAKNLKLFEKARHALPVTPDVLKRYKNPDGDPRGLWQSVSANVQAGHGTQAQFYELVAPNGTPHRPPHGRCWVYSESRMQLEIERGNIWFGSDGKGVPRIKRFLKESRTGITPHTLWTADEVGTTHSAKSHLLKLFPEEPIFDTPKPESLIKRILEIATEPDDFVLDAFLGSGTTAATAHKMGRRYIGIEVGDHATTLAAERMRQVVRGIDAGGITPDTGWTGGGGLHFYSCKQGLPAGSSQVTARRGGRRSPRTSSNTTGI